MTVTMQATAPGTAIYYTLNGTASTTASTLFSAPFTAQPEQIINAIAVAPGYANSLPSTVTCSDHVNNGFSGGAGDFSLNGGATTNQGSLIQLTHGGQEEHRSTWAPALLPSEQDESNNSDDQMRGCE